MWTPETPQGFESDKIKYLLPRYTRGQGVDVGCGMKKPFSHFIGVDNGHHYGKGAASIVAEGDDLGMFSDGALDFVFSSHLLEHLPDMGKALQEWGRVLKVGGFLVLYLPSANHYPKIGEKDCNPTHLHNLYPGDVAKLLRTGGYSWRQVEGEERSGGDEYSLFEVYKKLPTYNNSTKFFQYHKNRTTKTACVCRFGGFGDMLQTAVIFPGLKAQGYHVEVLTTPKGYSIIKHDPYVDSWHIVDNDQVPNEELGLFWKAQAERYDKFINLSESIEGALLALPGRIAHSWPKEARRKLMGRNYHEWTCLLAGVPFKRTQLFYAGPDEALERTPGRFMVMWALSGSSCHKFTPHQDTVIARMLLDMPEVHITLVGDDACRLLEQGWENEARIRCTSGELGIRETLALAQQMDLVVGPETGVLNAVGMDDRPSKVISLSHSSANNLTKQWVNTQALTPVDCPCYPCHLLHYGPDHCDIDPETGAARCAVNISPDVIYAAIQKVYRKWKTKK